MSLYINFVIIPLSAFCVLLTLSKIFGNEMVIQLHKQRQISQHMAEQGGKKIKRWKKRFPLQSYPDLPWSNFIKNQWVETGVNSELDNTVKIPGAKLNGRWECNSNANWRGLNQCCKKFFFSAIPGMYLCSSVGRQQPERQGKRFTIFTNQNLQPACFSLSALTPPFLMFSTDSVPCHILVGLYYSPFSRWKLQRPGSVVICYAFFVCKKLQFCFFFLNTEMKTHHIGYSIPLFPLGSKGNKFLGITSPHSNTKLRWHDKF